MRPVLPCLALLAVLAVTGCGGGSSDAAPPTSSSAAASSSADGYSAEVRENFLISCVANAANSATGDPDEEQLAQTCECILGKVEQEFSESEFAAFEKRLLSGEASEQENAQLVDWSTSCAQESTS